MKNIVLIILLIFCVNCASQTERKFNLGFEDYNKLEWYPDHWIKWGGYELEVDSITTRSGNYAVKITSSEKSSNKFGSIALGIPANYDGTTIRLEGYMKLKNVTNGFGGLLMRIDGEGGPLEFDNMKNQAIQGTKDWQKYSITLPYPKNAKIIYVAGLLVGEGEAWFDDFVLKIDGNDIQTLEEKERPVYKATLDKEFDLDSTVDIPKLNEELTGNLELLGKVWGFLKYYHPELGKGNYNWDYELFRMLPKYMGIKGNLERDKYLLEWISKYGEIEKCKACKATSTEAIIKPDMSWFNEFELDPDLKDKLEYIYQNRSQGNHFYIGSTTVGNPNFLNENHYYSMSYDDDGFKLLALYRYWNMIHYFFPNKHLTDNDWGGVLKEYIPKFVGSKTKLDYESACTQLIGEINDSHGTAHVGFTMVNKLRGTFYAPFKVRFIEDKLVVTDYYNPELKDVAKLSVGDIITHINNKPVQAIIDSIGPYYPASNNAAKLRDMSRDLLRSNKMEMNIGYIADHQKKQHPIALYKEADLDMRWYGRTDGKSYKMLDGNIGYVTLKTITDVDIPVLKETFKETKGIIIDIRNYPSTFVPFKLGSYFISSSTPFVKFSNFNKDNVGEFTFTKTLSIPAAEEPYKGKLVILVNEETQSQAEYTSMAFRAGDNTTIVGSTTAGADGNVSHIYLPGGLLTNISGIGVYYPDGTETQRVGIVPDVIIRPSIEGIRQGRDELLEKAIEIIKE